MLAPATTGDVGGTRTSRLERLEEDVTRSLRYLGDDPPNWVPATQGVDHDVLVVGGGQTGVTVAFALRRAGIGNVLVIDAQPQVRAGTWAHRARMRTLRTPKKISGPELGIPALSFPAWYEALHGSDSFASIGRIALKDWADYIAWYQEMVHVKVQYGSSAVGIESDGKCLRVSVNRDGVRSTLAVRKIVLAMGMVGAGTPHIPAAISKSLPTDRYAHTDDDIDFAALKGKRVVVVGAASSAFDAAGLALESGAAEVHLLCRANDLARAAREWPLGYPGAGNHFGSLPDADRWKLGRILRARAPGPMPDTVRRAARFDNFHLHLESTLDAAACLHGELKLALGSGDLACDFIIFGTGYTIDPGAQPLLKDVAPHVATWSDRYTPPPELQSPAGGRYPYLGDGYEFLEKVAGTAAYVRNIHCFNFAAIMSYGRTVGDIASLQTGVPRLVAAISRSLFLEDRDHHMKRLTASAPLELTGDEYRHAIWPRQAYAV